MDLFDGMLQKDKDEFKRVANRLVGLCFIIKNNERTKSDYYYILRNRAKFEEYFDVIGCALEINEEYGVVQLVNRENFNHVHLRLNDSIILLILRILYDEKKRELSLGDVVVNIGDIQEKYLSLKIREKQIDKTTMNNALRTLKHYNLIELLDKNLSEEDARILIYDSILMAVRVDDIRKLSEMIDKYRKGREADTDEAFTEDQAD